MSLWAGRFKEEMHPLVKEFTYSAAIDKKLYKFDIEGSIAHVQMLAKCGIIANEDSERLVSSLKKIQEDIEKGKINFSGKEDVHMAIEEELIKREGKIGEKIHTARSRNDQVALDEKLYIREEINKILSLIDDFQKVLIKISEANKDVVLPGYTHLQYAQPISVAQYLLAYFWMLQRDKERLKDCYKRVNICPLGVAAIAGTSLPIDREYTAKLLDFSGITENSVDTVSDRDYIIEFLNFASIMMMHLSRLSEDIVLWSSPCFNFIEIRDSFATGSSIMPQKKNPDVAELVRGKTGKVYGALISLLVTMKGLPLSYNRDMQEDKLPLFQSVEEIKICLRVLTKLLENIKINAEKMRKEAEKGFFAATDLVEYLVKKGVTFRSAHRTVGQIVSYCIEKGKTFSNLTLQEYRNFSPFFEPDIRKKINLDFCVKNKESKGGTGTKSLEYQIKLAKKYLETQNE